MNRLSAISTQILPSIENVEPLPEPVISYTAPNPKPFLRKLRYGPLHLMIPVWILAPFFCLVKFFKGSVETKINLLLILIYQYFFHRKTKISRRIFEVTKHYRFFDGYELILEDKDTLKPEKSLFPFHPHGIVCYGMNITSIVYPFFHDAEIVGSRMAFQHPWGGLVMKFYGVEGANPANFNRLMSENKNIMFVPGGFEEATITRYGKDRVFIKHRKGFIKLALEYGYTIHPCYIFGENKLYYTYTNQTLGLFLNKFKMPGLLAYTKNGIIPNDDVRLSAVIGRGIKIPICPNPPQDLVDKYHTIYIEKLVEMYDRFKHRCGGNEKLEIL